MNPDLMFLGGLIILALVFPATVGAFSSSDRTFRPVIICILLGGGLVAYAMSLNPQGYTAEDIPRIVRELFR